MARWGTAQALSVMLALTACSEEQECATSALTTDVACETAQDCIDQGFQNLACVNAVCRRICETDADCRPVPDEDEDMMDMCAAESLALLDAVCEARLCVAGCADDAGCEANETCNDGRCELFREGFELRDVNGVPDLEVYGWNDIPVEIPNPEPVVVFEGIRGCVAGDERCAGRAADGVRFLALERAVTQAKGTAQTDATCRPCACCLECLFAPEDDPPVQLSACPEDRPSPLMCPVSTPSRCTDVCMQCDSCPDANLARIQDGLVDCERTVAAKTCPSCLTCEADKATCQAAMCPSCASGPSSRECRECVDANCLGSPACGSCTVCDDARECRRTDPGSAECATNIANCNALGADGCFPAAVGYLRSQLTDLEQAVVSPAVNLAGASGQVVLELAYVNFNVGETYRPGIQGTPPDEWPVRQQQVRIELCGGGCEQETAWQLAKLVDGNDALVPAADRRNNGLLLGSQTGLDWQAGRIRVDVPDALRTAGFRFRFVPDISTDARVGIDAIVIRRLK